MTRTESLLETTVQMTAGGKRLRGASLGTGPPLVLLHGYPENLQIWSRLAPRLAPAFQVRVFDWPGMGYSDAWPGGATPLLMARRLATLLDEWQLERVILLGMDMGGQPALTFAAHYPQRVDRLVVMNSLVFGDAPTSWEIRLLRRFGFNRFVLRNMPRLIFRRAEATFLPLGVRLDPATRDDLWGAFQRPEVRQFISKMCAGYQGALEELPRLYDRIRCPTLVLWAERDKHFPLVQAQRLHDRIAGSRLQVIPQGTHWMAWHRPAEVADCLRQWCGR